MIGAAEIMARAFRLNSDRHLDRSNKQSCLCKRDLLSLARLIHSRAVRWINIEPATISFQPAVLFHDRGAVAVV
jgi:hypothetical protein